MQTTGKTNSRVDPALAGMACERTGALHRMFSQTVGGPRILVAVAAIWLVAVASVACASAAAVTPGAADGTSNLSAPGNSNNSGNVTVPDEISELDSEEVERRLGRLLSEHSAGEGDTAAAQELEPTPASNEPTLQEILDLLNFGSEFNAPKEIVISISPETISGLVDPVLTIKTPPLHGSAVVISPTRILYVPGVPGGGDSFEYELFDGTKSVVSLVVELRQ